MFHDNDDCPDREAGEDEELAQYGKPISYRNRISECPNCHKPVTDEMDSCPYCGDILFRYLTDGTFSPPKGPLTKIMAVFILIMVVLAVIGMILYIIGV